MFNDLTSLQSYFTTRRSGRPREMVAPGPNDAQLRSITETALRTPDHGKLAPWRFIIIADSQRDALANVMADAFRKGHPDFRDGQIEAASSISHLAPALVMMIYSPRESVNIPKQEQLLSAGAAGMNLIHAAHSHGYVASWITGWACYDEHMRSAFCTGDEQIIGFFFMGSPSEPLAERPRPDPLAHISDWKI